MTGFCCAVRADTNASEQFKELRTPERNAIEGIPTCESDIYIQAPCYDFVYSPNNVAAINVRCKLLHAMSAPCSRPVGNVVAMDVQSR